MNVYTHLIEVLERIAFGTNIRRSQTDDEVRIEMNGGSIAELKQQVRTQIERLEDLERTLA